MFHSVSAVSYLITSQFYFEYNFNSCDMFCHVETKDISTNLTERGGLIYCDYWCARPRPTNNILHAKSLLNSHALVVPVFCIPSWKIIASNRIWLLIF